MRTLDSYIDNLAVCPRERTSKLSIIDVPSCIWTRNSFTDRAWLSAEPCLFFYQLKNLYDPMPSFLTVKANSDSRFMMSISKPPRGSIPCPKAYTLLYSISGSELRDLSSLLAFGLSWLSHRSWRLQASGMVEPLVSSVLENGHALTEDEVVHLFEARGAEFHHVCDAANLLRQRTCGDRCLQLPPPPPPPPPPPNSRC